MKPLTLIDYRHPATGFGLPLPRIWELTEDPQPGVALTAVEPQGELAFRANLVVTVDDLEPDTDLEAWQDDCEAMMPDVLSGYQLLDRELSTDGTHPVLRRLAHHDGNGTASITMEQWALLVDGRGYTVTGSVATGGYADVTDMFTEIASRLRPDRGGHREGSR